MRSPLPDSVTLRRNAFTNHAGHVKGVLTSGNDSHHRSVNKP